MLNVPAFYRQLTRRPFWCLQATGVALAVLAAALVGEPNGDWVLRAAAALPIMLLGAYHLHCAWHRRWTIPVDIIAVAALMLGGLWAPALRQMALVALTLEAIHAFMRGLHEDHQPVGPAEPKNGLLVDLLENANDWIWSVDSELRLTFFNAAMQVTTARLFGVKLANGSLPEQIFPPDLAVHWRELYQRALTGQHYTTELPYPDGVHTLYIEATLNPIGTDGHLTGLSVHARDITDRREAELSVKRFNELLEERVAEHAEQLADTQRQRQDAQVELRQSEPPQPTRDSRFQLLAAAASEAIVIHRDGLTVDVNPAFEQMFGYSAEECRGRPFDEVITLEEPVASEAHLAADDDQLFEMILVSRDGRRLSVEGHDKEIMLDGELAQATILRDLTDRRQSEATRRAHEALLRTVIDHAPIMLWAIDHEGIYTLSEGKGLVTVGRRPGEAVGQSVFDLFKGQPAMLGFAERALAGEAVTDIITIADRLFQASHVPVYDTAGQVDGVIGVAIDITERTALEEQLSHQVYHDALTGLPNRLLFIDRLEQALKRRGSEHTVAVLFLDLDRFKVINDSLGHATGDRLLIAVANRLQMVLRPEDTVARLGGDEFSILLEILPDPHDAVAIAERITQAMQAPFLLDDQEIVTTTSIGIATRGIDLDQPEDLIRAADVAMYRAKQAGRCRVVAFDQSMQAGAVERLELERDLRYAMERGELKVFFQPLVDIETDRLIGFEALARWRHPRRGWVAPKVFIPLAEETGLILPIGEWVLAEACRCLHIWNQRYPVETPRIVNVNLSGRQFHHARLVETIARVLVETDLEPGCLTLELTESTIMEMAEINVERLRELKRLGVRLAIDDFGTGYSSLSYLKRFPVDLLKIDQSFVAGLGENPEDTAIVQSIVTLASAVGLDVMAEGIERAEQVTSLLALGCRTGQGYHFGRPADQGSVEKFLAGQRPAAQAQSPAAAASGLARKTRRSVSVEARSA